MLILYAGRLLGSCVRSDGLNVMPKGDQGGRNRVVRLMGRRIQVGPAHRQRTVNMLGSDGIKGRRSMRRLD